ncbi:NusG domain II-containing protein [Floccifex sp.]|uniref:NusG domain II-containing protein n=1 Tax=Floccifex sp. TaxID=2815810 RepID=UPI002A75B1FF|nr:NusG domain II-containing protein [Floccifex sp.]MDD7280983.1 NusG domain II-containing protein [Erysipelotrichaceae bacterium]MDY2958943.1 NusG domain II-containing protein [Floccifex sp.]
MTKADKILICLIMIASIVCLIPLFLSNSQKECVVVQVKNKEVLRLDLNENGTWTVDGTLGNVVIEIKDGKVRVTQENSPQHLCSKQGYVSNANVPIVCLPNETVVQIESDTSEDTVVQ